MMSNVSFSYEKIDPPFNSFSEKIRSSVPEKSLFSFLGLGLVEICIRGKSHDNYSINPLKILNEQLSEYESSLIDEEAVKSFTATKLLLGFINTSRRSEIFTWLHQSYIKENLYDFPSRLTHVFKTISVNIIKNPELKAEILSKNVLNLQDHLELIMAFTSFFKICVRVFSENKASFKDYFEQEGLLPVIYLQKVNNEFFLLRNTFVLDFDFKEEAVSELMVLPFTIDCKKPNSFLTNNLLQPISKELPLFIEPIKKEDIFPSKPKPINMPPFLNQNKVAFPPPVNSNQAPFGLPSKLQNTGPQIPPFIQPANVPKVPDKSQVPSGLLPIFNPKSSPFPPNGPEPKTISQAPVVSSSENTAPLKGFDFSGVPKFTKPQEVPEISKEPLKENPVLKPVFAPQPQANILKKEPSNEKEKEKEKKIELPSPLDFPKPLPAPAPNPSQIKDAKEEVKEKPAEISESSKLELETCKEIIKSLSYFIINANINISAIKGMLEKTKGATPILSQIEGAKELLKETKAFVENYCTVCKEVRSPSDFEIYCRTLNQCQVCMNCRIESEFECPTCSRGYSDSETEYLLVIKASKNFT